MKTLTLFPIFLAFYFVFFMVVSLMVGTPFDAVRNLVISLIVAGIATIIVRMVAMSSK